MRKPVCQFVLVALGGMMVLPPASAARAEPGGLRVGAARVDVTPP